MRTKHTTVYTYNELSDKAKERARNWYREGNLDYDWWDCLYEDFGERAQELGIDLGQKPVLMMNGKTRYDPEIYFSGFYHQGSGSSFSGTWRADAMNINKLKADCPTDKELHRIADSLAECAREDGEATATISAKRDHWIEVIVEDGHTLMEQWEALDPASAEYTQIAQGCQDREDAITEALRDFNHWMYRCLEQEYDWLNSDEQVEDAIMANAYEFTEDGQRA